MKTAIFLLMALMIAGVKIFGTDQGKLTKILRHRIDRFSTDRLRISVFMSYAKQPVVF